MTGRKSLFEKSISLYSFVLTVLVIWIHAAEPAAADSAAYASTAAEAAVRSLLGSSLGELAVPGFFCMSGYLFFRNMRADEPSETAAGIFAGKLKHRIYSLLLPYLIWNLIYYVVYMAAGRAEPGISELIAAAVEYRYNPVFWYLHELIIITVLTPVIYILCRKVHTALLCMTAVFAAAVCYDMLPLHIVNEDALFYYICGAVLALHCGKRETDRECIGRMGAVCFIIYVLSEELCMNAGPNVRLLMTGLIAGRISGLLALFGAVCMCVRSESRLPAYTEYNFLIYALHYLEIRLIHAASEVISKVLFGISYRRLPWADTLLYILMPFLCIAMTAVIGGCMRKYVPKMYGLLTGGRA